MRTTVASITALLTILACQPRPAADPLPSWTEGEAKAAIVDFVDRVTDPAHTDYRPVDERVAVFDNDGCLWAEKPVYFQLLFALDRVRAMAPDHPEWRSQEPFASALAGDMEGLAAQGEHGILELVMATHAGMTTDEAKKLLMENLEAQVRREAATRAKEILDEAEQNADKEAREIITHAIYRCAADHTVETTVSVVAFP